MYSLLLYLFYWEMTRTSFIKGGGGGYVIGQRIGHAILIIFNARAFPITITTPV